MGYQQAVAFAAACFRFRRIWRTVEKGRSKKNPPVYVIGRYPVLVK